MAEPPYTFEDVKEGKDYHFPAEEEAVLALWARLDAFREQLRRSEGRPEYVFYDGPPFATGMPHYGHLLAGTIKDVVTRFACGTGHHVPRRFGWDCHGLPVEHEIDKALGVKTRGDVLAMGIDVYNEHCRAIVMRYAREWEAVVTRLGRWIDFKDDYKTLDAPFMESVWWVFKQLWDKGLVYRGFKVMPYSTGCSTPLSNFEAGQNYRDVSDPAVVVAFPVDGDAHGAALCAWTTTPWTLPSNLALCVHPELQYVCARDPATGAAYWVAEARLDALPGAVPKKGKKGGADGAAGGGGFEILERRTGAQLVGLTYEPAFPYFAHLKRPGGAFRVLADGYVTADSGTGVVHQAPAFGEDDARVCLAAGVVTRGAPAPCPVDDAGRFTAEVPDFAGAHVKDADKDVIAYLKRAGRLVSAGSVVHSYPFCWRSDTPLIYRAVPSWFVRVEELKPRLLANNAATRWVPPYVQEKRFHNWLEQARDWAVSRSRFWGTPMPIWASEDLDEVVVVGSVAELREATGCAEDVTDLHRHFIDHLTIPSRKNPGGPPLRRVDDVFDCWFESGAMPYAQAHFPFENADLVARGAFPADFVAEGLDQTRGWFYTLSVLSTALFDAPPFKNLVCNGLVLAADGKKMSKRLQNYPDPMHVVNRYGADALRLYLINSPVVRAETLRFREDGVAAVLREVFLPWYNAYRFFVQNARRWEAEGAGAAPGGAFERLDPAAAAAPGAAANVLDRWIGAATRTLVREVRAEMGAYRLYAVVPRLVRFVGQLTNIYVRYNRRRLKGRGGRADARAALATLHGVLSTLARVAAPFTPFFAEAQWQNLRRALGESAEASVHWAAFPAEPAAEAAADAQLQRSVDRMQAVVEAARAVRERAGRSVKTPVRELTVVHADAAFLGDLAGQLAGYVAEEVNARRVTPCGDPLRWATPRAAPNFDVLGPRLGRGLAPVAAAIRAMSVDDVLAYEAAGDAGVELAGARLGPGDVKVVREFRQPPGTTAADIDAAGDGEVLVVVDLAADDELLGAGLAREAVNRVQKLRKHAGLRVGDAIDVYCRVGGAAAAAGALGAALAQEAAAVAEALGVPLRVGEAPPGGADVAADEAVELPVPGADAPATLQITIVRLGGGDAGGAAAALAAASLG